MGSLFVIVFGLVVSWWLSDISDGGFLQGVLAPLSTLVFLISLAVWLVLKAGFGSKVSRGGGVDGFSGGDGGGGDGC